MWKPGRVVVTLKSIPPDPYSQAHCREIQTQTTDSRMKGYEGYKDGLQPETQAKKGINSELEGANARRVLNIPSKRSLYLMRTSAHLQKKST